MKRKISEYQKAKDDDKLAGITVLKTLGQNIPIVNSAIYLADSYKSQRKYERLTEFCEDLNEKIKAIDSKLYQDYIAQDDFLDLFEKTANKISIERTAEKRRAYSNILFASMTASSVDYDKTEKYIRDLESLSNLELHIFHIFSEPESYNAKCGYPLGQSEDDQTLLFEDRETVIQVLLPEQKIEEIEDAIIQLVDKRLLYDWRGKILGGPTPGINKLKTDMTEKGKEFIKYLMGDTPKVI